MRINPSALGIVREASKLSLLSAIAGLTLYTGCLRPILRGVEDRDLQSLETIALDREKPVVRNIQDYMDEISEESSSASCEEAAMIAFHSKRIGVDQAILRAIRKAENGKDGREYGIIPLGKLKQKYQEDNGYNSLGAFIEYKNEQRSNYAGLLGQ